MKKGKLSHRQPITDKTEHEVLTNVLEDVDDEERRDQVIDALHVAAGGMADGPDEQDPFKYLEIKHRDSVFGHAKLVKHNDVNLKSNGANAFFSRVNCFSGMWGWFKMQVWNIAEDFMRTEKEKPEEFQSCQGNKVGGRKFSV